VWVAKQDFSQMDNPLASAATADLEAAATISNIVTDGAFIRTGEFLTALGFEVSAEAGAFGILEVTCPPAVPRS
jgi:hypothetical protein